MEQMLTRAMKQVSLDMYVLLDADFLIKSESGTSTKKMNSDTLKEGARSAFHHPGR